MNSTGISLGGLPLTPPPGVESRAITAENPEGAKGAGGRAGNGRKGAPALSPLPAGQTVTLADIQGPGCIRHIWITTPPGYPLQDRNVILRFYWEGQEQPSVECPLGDFFGMAHGRRRPFASALTLMPEGRGLSCYYTMPFRQRARITVENDSGEDVAHLFYQIDYTVGDELTADTACFHAQFRRQNPTTLKQDYVILDGVQGRGRFLGCVVGLRTLDDHWWGEGEFKFYLDGDKDYPTLCGTGSEDYACSAWGIGVHDTPYHGCPLYARGEKGALDALISYYRWHILDPIYFHKDIKVAVQQMGGASVAAVRERVERGELEVPTPLAEGQQFTLFERQDDYCSTAFWYQTLPTAPFPAFPDRALRSVGLEKRPSE
ncbi:MAG TPA: glycoside hydrolase family 172 protein [Chthonomonadaceae bacterium]|nr:glycoside hydrolase family 172 protein [Chthonomonadaceae bacterium]